MEFQMTVTSTTDTGRSCTLAQSHHIHQLRTGHNHITSIS